MSFPNKFTRFDKSILSKISMLIIDEVSYIDLSELIEMRLGKVRISHQVQKYAFVSI